MMARRTMATIVFAVAAVLGLVQCNGSGSTRPPLRPALPGGLLLRPNASPIQHIVIIMQENRTLDNLFNGYPGANTVTFGYGHNGRKHVLKSVSMASPLDLNHARIQFLQDYDGGKMDGFDRNIVKVDPNCPSPPASPDPYNQPSCWTTMPNPLAYAFVPRRETKPLWDIAQQYVLGDNTFASNNGPSFPSHLYMIAGGSVHVTDNPLPTQSDADSTAWGCDSSHSDTLILRYGSTQPPNFPPAFGLEEPGAFPCFTYKSMATTLDAAHVPWKYYAPFITTPGGIWSAFDAIYGVRYGTDWLTKVVTPESTILEDVRHDRLPEVSWVVPSFYNSDHSGSMSTTGPRWVATIVNAIGKSQYWKNTAIVVLWDDWGGWYDHVPPPQYPDPVTGAYEGLGFRVPLLVISPYAKPGYVSHQQHEIASTLHFIEQTFGLPSLGRADARADALQDCFDFSQTPIVFKPIPTGMRPADFLEQRASSRPPDD